jgi:hypothetical protein
VSLLRRLPKIVAVVLSSLVGLLAVVAASVFAYGEAESNRMTYLPEPTGPYAVGRVSYHWIDRSREEVFTQTKGDERELMVFVWYPAEKPGPHASTAAYLPGKWGEERQKEYGNLSFLTQGLGSVRTTIWREVRRLGVLSLQHAVCLLPLSDENRAAYERIARRIEEYGGEASILETASPSDAWHERIVARFNAARDEEYEEVVDETERFREEIEREKRKGKFTFAELEDEESNLERLHKYLARVEARDAFGAKGRVRAAEEVERCVGVLEAFAQEIYEHQRVAEGEEGR